MAAPVPSISVRPLAFGEEPLWADFLAKTDATLFHDLRFLAYHSEGRFHFHHLIARRSGEIVAIIPGGWQSEGTETRYISPLGASVGGPATLPGLASADALDIVAALQRYALDQGWSGIDVTLAPAAYGASPNDALSFAFFYQGFQLSNRWLCPMIPLSGTAPDRYRALFRDTYANRVRAGRRRGITVAVGGLDQLQQFFSVFHDTYKRHGVSATHSLEEIADLVRRLPEQIAIHLALLNGEPVAGILLFLLNPRIAYTFYICMSAAHARESGNVLVMASAIDWLAARGFRWLDLGPTARANNFNPGVTFFKEGLGAIGHCRDQWCWRTSPRPRM